MSLKILILLLSILLTNLCQAEGGTHFAEITAFVPEEYLPVASQSMRHTFEACQKAGIKLLDRGTEKGICEQRVTDSFKELSGINKLGEMFIFQQKLKERVDTSLKFKLLQIERLLACSKKDMKWFNDLRITHSNVPPSDQIEKYCEQELAPLKSEVLDNFSLMRIHLSLSSSAIRNDSLTSDRSGWLEKRAKHPVMEFSKLPNLSGEELKFTESLFASHMAQMLLDKRKKKSGRLEFSEGLSKSVSIEDAIKKGREGGSSEMSDQESLANYIQLDQNFTVNAIKASDIDKIRKGHKDAYFAILGNHPLLGYVDKENPSDSDLAKAFLKMKVSIEDYLKKMSEAPKNSNQSTYDLVDNFNYSEYGAYLPEINSILVNEPGYCGVAESLLNEKKRRESNKNKVTLAIGALSLVPCVFSGPVAMTTCFGVGAGIAGNASLDAYRGYQNSLARGLTNEEFGDFEKVAKNQKSLYLTSTMFATNFTGLGKAVGKQVQVKMYEREFALLGKSKIIENKTLRGEATAAWKEFRKARGKVTDDKSKRLGPLENLAHTKRVAIAGMRDPKYLAWLKSEGKDIDTILTAAIIHDIGKTPQLLFPKALEIAKASGRTQPSGDDFFKAFLKHDDTAVEWVEMREHLKRVVASEQKSGKISETVERLADAIRGHNGPGGNFWYGRNHKANFGKDYELPESYNGVVLTLFDRKDQGTLIKVIVGGKETMTGGPRKILIDNLNSKKMTFAEAVVESLQKNPAETLLQVESLVKLPVAGNLKLSPMVKEANKSIRETMNLGKRIEVPDTKGDFVIIGGVRVTTPDELFQALASSTK